MTKHVKRGSNGAGFIVGLFVLVNIFIFLPFFLFFFYTLTQILPTLAVVTNPDTSTYVQVPLSDLYADGTPSLSPAPPRQQSGLFSLGLGMGPMVTHLLSLRLRFKPLALFRGVGIFTLISILEALVAGISTSFLPAILAVLPQIVLPLAWVQLYSLWTHTVLTYPSAKSLWQRIPPFKLTLRSTGPALTVFLAGKALLKFAIWNMYGFHGLGQKGIFYPSFLGALILAWIGVEVLILVPAHMVLTRIQACFLPEGEKTIVPVDEALDGHGDTVGMKEAWRTFGWGAWKRLGLLYAQVFAVVLVGGGVLLAADFVLYTLMALLTM